VNACPYVLQVLKLHGKRTVIGINVKYLRTVTYVVMKKQKREELDYDKCGGKFTTDIFKCFWTEY